MDATWSSILTTGPHLSGDVPMTVADHLTMIADHWQLSSTISRRLPPISDQSPTILWQVFADPSNFYWLLPTSHTISPRLIANQIRCDSNIFFPNACRWSLVVGTFFGCGWSATGHTPGVTGPLRPVSELIFDLEIFSHSVQAFPAPVRIFTCLLMLHKSYSASPYFQLSGYYNW